MTGAAALGLGVPPTAALHALTVGALALMVLAVMARVSVAHTGRRLHAPVPLIVAWSALMLVALVRVFSPFGPVYIDALLVAGAGWMAVFGTFMWVYAPLLVTRSVEK
jgi:uncharacterized protein involved in response to NO